MSDSTQSTAGEQFNEYAEAYSRTFFEALEENMRMQSAFLDSWRESLDSSAMDETAVDGMQGVSRAYEVWMEAAEANYELVDEAMRGEDVDVESFRDVWLNAANEAFKEVMGTTAFAAATGQTIGDVLEASQQVDRLNRQTLQTLGVATAGDIEEVGERLVELERRQHAVEEKLDRLIEMAEEQTDDS
ncbi:MAG: poly(R)-hydroxyalkanoic acid synthase subunit [Halohasta sp.]